MEEIQNIREELNWWREKLITGVYAAQYADSYNKVLCNLKTLESLVAPKLGTAMLTGRAGGVHGGVQYTMKALLDAVKVTSLVSTHLI